MKTNLTISIFFSVLCFLPGRNLMAQSQVSAYTDLGWNNVSDGLFIKTAGLAQYQFGKYEAGAGIQIDLKSNNKNVLSGYNFYLSRNCMIKNFPLEVQSFFLLTPFSDILRETDWGFLLNIKLNHVTISAGTNFRTTSFTKNISSYELDTKNKFREPWNLMYSFSYYLKPLDNPWNLNLSITDIDNFVISQESNPVINLRASCELSSRLNLFVESWHRSSGVFNLSKNNFGFYFRTGITWNIN
jgi:hypothetical protein